MNIILYNIWSHRWSEREKSRRQTSSSGSGVTGRSRTSSGRSWPTGSSTAPRRLALSGTGLEFSTYFSQFCDLDCWLIVNMSRFRALGRLEGKFDETMVEYYLAFMAMCKRVAGLPLSEEEGKIDVSWLQTRLFQCFPRETFVLVIFEDITFSILIFWLWLHDTK